MDLKLTDQPGPDCCDQSTAGEPLGNTTGNQWCSPGINTGSNPVQHLRQWSG